MPKGYGSCFGSRTSASLFLLTEESVGRNTPRGLVVTVPHHFKKSGLREAKQASTAIVRLPHHDVCVRGSGFLGTPASGAELDPTEGSITGIHHNNEDCK